MLIVLDHQCLSETVNASGSSRELNQAFSDSPSVCRSSYCCISGFLDSFGDHRAWTSRVKVRLMGHNSDRSLLPHFLNLDLLVFSKKLFLVLYHLSLPGVSSYQILAWMTFKCQTLFFVPQILLAAVHFHHITRYEEQLLWQVLLTWKVLVVVDSAVVNLKMADSAYQNQSFLQPTGSSSSY